MPWNDDPETARLNHEALLLVEERGELGLWSWQIETARLHWSAGMYRVLGLPAFAAAPSLELFSRLVHPEDRTGSADILQAFGTGGDCRLRIIRRDGEMRWLRSCGRVVHNAAGAPERVVGVTFDITQQVRADAAYQRESGLLDAVQELVGGPVWMSAADGKPLELTEWHRALPPDGGHQPGFGTLDDVHPDDRAGLRAAWTLALQTGAGYAATYRARRDGGWVERAARAVPIRDAAGTILAWLGCTTPLATAADSGSEAQPTARQIRGARGLLGWTASDLAERSGLSFSTIRRAEAGDRGTGVGAAAANAIRTAFTAAGIRFGAAPDGALSLTLDAQEPYHGPARPAPLRQPRPQEATPR